MLPQSRRAPQTSTDTAPKEAFAHWRLVFSPKMRTKDSSSRRRENRMGTHKRSEAVGGSLASQEEARENRASEVPAGHRLGSRRGTSSRSHTSEKCGRLATET